MFGITFRKKNKNTIPINPPKGISSRQMQNVEHTIIVGSKKIHDQKALQRIKTFVRLKELDLKKNKTVEELKERNMLFEPLSQVEKHVYIDYVLNK